MKCNTCGTTIPRESQFQHYCTEECWLTDKNKRDQELQQEQKQNKISKLFKRKPGRPPKNNKEPELPTPPPKVEVEDEPGELDTPSPPQRMGSAITTSESRGSEESPDSPQQEPQSDILTTKQIWNEAKIEATKLGCNPSQYLLAHTVLQNIYFMQQVGLLIKKERGEPHDEPLPNLDEKEIFNEPQ